MKRTQVSVWYDPDVDILEVLFEKKAGYFDNVDEAGRFLVRYDDDGNVTGFMVHGLTAIEGGAVDFELKAKEPQGAGG